jgi:hypothetical protein
MGRLSSINCIDGLKSLAKNTPDSSVRNDLPDAIDRELWAKIFGGQPKKRPDTFSLPGRIVRFIRRVRLFAVTVGVGRIGPLRCTRHIGNQIDNYLMVNQWPTPPILGNAAEHPVLNFVPFAGAGRKMAYINQQARFIGKLLSVMSYTP